MRCKVKICQALPALALFGCMAQVARGQATLSLTAPACVNGNTLEVKMDLASTQIAVGAQVFLKYEKTKLEFVSADPGIATFTNEVYEFHNLTDGEIDYAVGIPGGGTGAASGTMARFTFTIKPGAEGCSVAGLVSFRASGPGGAENKVGNDQVPSQPILPLATNNLPAIRIDQTAPVAVKKPPSMELPAYAACYATVELAEAAALERSSVTDTCPGVLTPIVQTTGDCAAVVTVKFQDECGNLSNTLTFLTRIDNEKPTISCPANVTVTALPNQCTAVVTYDAPITSDNCDLAPPPTPQCSMPSGSTFLAGETTVTCTATDTCGNVSLPCTFKVTVNLLPTTLTLASTGCQPNGQLVVDINMSNACETVVGGQYFLEYDTTRLTFVSADPGDPPFTKEVFEFINPTAGLDVGWIDYATGIADGDLGTNAPTTMARITFNVLESDCDASDLVTWRPTGPNGIPNRLSDDQVPAQPILPLDVVDLSNVTLDITDPIITGVPSNTTVECDAVPSGPATLPASDICDLSVTEATLNVDEITDGPCTHAYTIKRTWTATDACGNSATATQIITVQDTTAPTVDPAPDDVTISCEEPLPVAPETLPASDNCDPTVASTGATLNEDQITEGSCAGNYIVTRTWTATDACGNSTTRTQTITVQDITPPTISCAPGADFQCGSDVPEPNINSVTASDLCGSVIVTHEGDVITPVVPTCPNVYTLTRTYKATDECGNFDTCTQVFDVNDTIIPDITLNGMGVVHIQCNTTPYVEEGATWTDNCDGGPFVVTSINYSPSMPTTLHGTYTVFYDAVDACGNAALQVTRTVIIEEPNPTCNSPQPLVIPCQCAAACVPATDPTIAAWLASPVAVDGCDNDAVITGHDAPACFPVGTTIVTWTVVDNHHVPPLVGSCTSTVTVEADTTAPTITCPAPVTVQCAALVPAADFAGGSASDNCGGVPTINHLGDAISAMTCINRYTVTRTYQATDACGNTSTCSQTITVNDNTPPGAVSSGPIAACYTTIAAAQAAALANSSAMDNCLGAVTPTATPIPTGSPCEFEIFVDFVDSCGNTAFLLPPYLTRVDNTPPTINCPGPVTLQCPSLIPPANFAGGTVSDNCGGTPTVNHVGDVISAMTCANRYTITRTYLATDACGKTATCDQIITVNDTTDPTISCPAPLTVQCASLVPPADFAGGTASDNCGGTPTVNHVGDAISAMTCANRYTITRTYLATDACGNTATCDQTITVNDTTAPTITLCPSTINVHAAPGSCNSAPVSYSAAATDNCTASPTITFNPPSGSTFGPGTTPVLVTATDACGNSSTCTFNVINDGMVEMNVEVELGGGVMANGTFTRAITFALWNTTVDNVNPLHTTCVTMSFSGDFPVAKTATATILVPCQPTGYDCITARDRLHTLRRTISPIPITGPAYTPSFTGMTKALIGGNLNDDRFIDILDFGIYTTQDLTVAPGGVNTTCGQNPPGVQHADINGTPAGTVNSLDYSFIANNFLMSRENNCNGSAITIVTADGNTGARERDRPVTSITIAELHEQGLGELAVMDLNHDGVFNLTDRDLWNQGIRPTPAPTAPVDGKPLKTGLKDASKSALTP